MRRVRAAFTQPSSCRWQTHCLPHFISAPFYRSSRRARRRSEEASMGWSIDCGCCEAPATTARDKAELSRRGFLFGSGAVFGSGMFPAPAIADVPVPYNWNTTPPMDGRASFIEWMQKNRGEAADFLGQRWDRFE